MTVLVATFFTVVAVGTKSGIEPITCAVVGALLGFLLFNVYPASVFMGDTGSLALGGFVASAAYMLQMPIFIVIVGLDLSGRSIIGYDPGNITLKRPAEREYLKWRRYIIILNHVVVKESSESLYFPIIYSTSVPDRTDIRNDAKSQKSEARSRGIT